MPSYRDRPLIFRPLISRPWMAAAVVAAVMMLSQQRLHAADTGLDLPDDPSVAAAGAGGFSDSQSVPTQTPATAETEEQRRAAAQAQLEKQEKQRVFGVMATFNTTNNKDALPLSSRQKYQLFFKSATDPWPFLLAGFTSGIDQADNSFPEYGQGVQGYAKRFGASYTDYFTGNLLGNAVLASLLKEDPRYFQKGVGSPTSRALWAASSTVWCKRDNGSWGPNYANVVGNLMGAAVSNLYYPESDRTASGTIERGVTVTAEAIIGSEVIEFWPDIVKHHKRKQAEKMARLGNGAVKPVATPGAPAAPNAASPLPH
jgi:hypothetical protein